MTDFVLNTKLHSPILRPNVIHRQRLLNSLDSGVKQSCKITLISAPAGYGKTTLVLDWLQHSSRKYTWLSLDERDNDLLQFATYFSAALSQAGISLQDVEPETHTIENFFSLLINELDRSREKIVLVLDDFHYIQNPAIFELINYLITYLPSQLHLVLIARVYPAVQITRLRARHQINEIHRKELAFTAEETQIFLTKVMELKLSNSQIETLFNRTGGWATGLQLAALSLTHFMEDQETDHFIENFSGSSRLITDYFRDEVLNGLPQETRSFLLKTAVLGRFNAGLCQDACNFPEAGRILAQLEQTNLFIENLDDQSNWFQYHILFAELLQKQAEQEISADTIRSIYRKAARWHCDQGRLDEAVEFDLRAEDFESAANRIESRIQKKPAPRNAARFRAWIEKLPPAVRRQHPALIAAQPGSFQQPAEELQNFLLLEPLSKRETEVLSLIASGLSNQEISQKLYLAEGTVKKHNNNLFSKLNVHHRTEAVARARQLGIL